MFNACRYAIAAARFAEVALGDNPEQIYDINGGWPSGGLTGPAGLLADPQGVSGLGRVQWRMRTQASRFFVSIK